MHSRSNHTATAAAVGTLTTALAGLVMLPVLASAEDAGGRAAVPDAPAVVVRLAAASELEESLVYLARLAGAEEPDRLRDRLIAAATAGRGLAGIDRLRPAGGYGFIGPHGDDGAVVLIVPVADERAFVDLLEGGLHLALQAGGDGVYTAGAVELPGLKAEPVYVRIESGWAFVTVRDRGALARGRLLPPEAVLAGARCAGGGEPRSGDVASAAPVGDGPNAVRGCEHPATGLVSVTVNVDRIPRTFKEVVLGQLDAGLAQAKRDAPAFGTEGLWPFLAGIVDEIAASMATQLFEGAETSLRIDLDRRLGVVTLTVRIAARPGTAMAAAIAAFGQSTSVTAGLLRPGAAVAGALNVVMLRRERELLSGLVDGVRRSALAASGGELERIAVGTAFDTLRPTLEAGEIDLAFDLLGPGSDGLYSFIGAVKVRNGATLQRVFRLAPPRSPVTDARFVGTVAGSGVHRLTVDLDEPFRRVFGGNTAYLGFRDDAVFVAAGPRALGLVRETLPLGPVTAPRIGELRIAADRLMPLSGDPALQDLARSVLGSAKGGGAIRLKVEGGATLTLKLSMPAKLIEFASALGRGIMR